MPALHHIAEQRVQLTFGSVLCAYQRDQPLQQVHQIPLADMLLQQLQQRDPPMLHDVIIRNDGNIHQRKRLAVDTPRQFG